MPHSVLASAAVTAAAVSTRSYVPSSPPRRSSLISSCASISESSTSKTRRGFAMAGYLSPFLRRGLIQHNPVQPQLQHSLAKFSKIHRLPDVTVGAQTVAFNQVLLFL